MIGSAFGTSSGSSSPSSGGGGGSPLALSYTLTNNVSDSIPISVLGTPLLDSVVSSQGTDITYNNDGTFTLAPGKTYKLEGFSGLADNSNIANGDFGWVNTVGNVLLGIEGHAIKISNVVANRDGPNGVCLAFVEVVGSPLTVSLIGLTTGVRYYRPRGLITVVG